MTQPHPSLTPVAYDLEGAASAVALSSRHLRREIHAGRLRARMVDRKYRIGRADLEAWFEQLPEPM